MRRLRLGLFILFLCLPLASAQTVGSAQPRIRQAVDDETVVRLSGSTHPLAQARFDRGAAPDSRPAPRMLLVLQRGPEQQAALDRFLADLQDPSSPQYHQWLSPEQFGARFGPADADLATVTSWLRSHGFRIDRVAAGRNVIEFSGTAGQVREAFHAQIHRYVIDGNEHFANAADVRIPAALRPVVSGLVSLHDFRRKPFHRLRVAATSPLARDLAPDYTFNVPAGQFFGIGPYDFATIYNVLPAWNAGIDGNGQIVAIVARSNIDINDVREFRSLFGLPPNDPHVLLNGQDPGIVPGDETETVVDAEWSGAVAKGASIDLVVSSSTEVTDGVDLSALYIVENNFSGVLSMSYGACEAALGVAGNTFYQALWQQAAAQGITVLVASGDSGSAGCDPAFLAWSAQDGVAVSGVASTASNVAVGGTDFDDAGSFSAYWSSTSDPNTKASAKSYIPEMTWNETCSARNRCSSSGTTGPIAAAGGGPSSCSTLDAQGNCLAGTPKPSWQSGPGVPQDSVRDIPDVSLFSGGLSNAFYILCEQDLSSGDGLPCNLNPPYGDFLSVEGTSVSAQAFAGIMALVQQKTGSRQGNANYVFYPLAPAGTCASASAVGSPACMFYDISKGNNSVPCMGGTLDCFLPFGSFGVLADPKNYGQIAWPAASGYDMATGLGTVNVANLVNHWNLVSFTATSTTLVNISPTTITHGQPVNVTVTVAPTSGNGTPTGLVSLLRPGIIPLGIDTFALSAGTAVGSTTRLPGGHYSVFARYAGDGWFGASDSTPPVMLSVTPESSNIFLNLVTFDNAGVHYNPPSIQYGSPYILRADVTNSVDGFHPVPLCSTGCPVGSVSITANGQPLDAGTFPLNNQAYAEDLLIQLPTGPTVLHASYFGDVSFSPSSADLNVNLAKAATTLWVPTISAPSLLPGVPFDISTRVATQSSGVAPGGTITFFLDGNPLAGTPTYVATAGSWSVSASLQATLTATVNTSGLHFVTATYSGDSNYAAASFLSGTAIVLRYPTTTTFSVTPIAVQPGGAVDFTATVQTASKGPAMSGTVVFFAPAAGIGYNTLTPITDANGNVGLLATGTYNPSMSGAMNARYIGDSNYADSTSNSVNVAVGTPSVSVGSTPVTMSQGSSSVATLQLYGIGMGGTVTVTCTTPGSMAGGACNPATQNVDLPPGGQATATVTITTSIAHASSRVPARSWWFGFGSIVSAMVLFGVPRSKGRSRAAFWLLLLLLLPLLISCGGGGSGMAATNSSGGTPPVIQPQGVTTATGWYQVIIKVASNGQTVGSTTLMVNVQ